jgi:sugar O-acyltransferase (sialic acid O-acetyltransferase NeuD family)
MNNKKINIIGGGDNSKVLIDTINLSYNNYKINGIYDDSSLIKEYENIKLLGSILDIENKYEENVFYICSISNISLRNKIFKKLNNLNWISIIHKSCIISPTVKIGKGVFINVNCVINSNAIIEDFCILNTNTIIEHDVIINKNCIISPRVTICGNVIVKKNTFIGCGVIIINKNKYGNIVIGENNFITAGSLLLHSTTNNKKIRGVF